MTLPRTRRTSALAAAAVAILCLVLSSCGDDSTDSSTPSPVPNASLDATATQNLRDLTGKWGQATTKIVYILESASGSLSTQAQVTLYRGGSNSRIDHAIGARTTIVITRPDIGYSCLLQGSAGSCALLTTAEAEDAARFVPFVEDLAKSDKVAEIISGSTTLDPQSPRSVAGVQASCIRSIGTLGGISGEATWCFSDDGLLLAMTYKSGSQTFDMTATAIQDVQDKDFDPPYPVVTLPPAATPTPAP